MNISKDPAWFFGVGKNILRMEISMSYNRCMHGFVFRQNMWRCLKIVFQRGNFLGKDRLILSGSIKYPIRYQGTLNTCFCCSNFLSGSRHHHPPQQLTLDIVHESANSDHRTHKKAVNPHGPRSISRSTFSKSKKDQ